MSYIDWSDDDLNRLSTTTTGDMDEAVLWWRRFAGRLFAGLLDAIQV